jgi:hypothetical protein
MKLMAICLTCERELLLDQLIEDQPITGACPWCGMILAPDYLELLPEVILRAEQSGTELESALHVLAGGWAGFVVEPSSVLQPISESLDFEERRVRGASRPAGPSNGGVSRGTAIAVVRGGGSHGEPAAQGAGTTAAARMPPEEPDQEQILAAVEHLHEVVRSAEDALVALGG